MSNSASFSGNALPHPYLLFHIKNVLKSRRKLSVNRIAQMHWIALMVSNLAPEIS